MHHTPSDLSKLFNFIEKNRDSRETKFQQVKRSAQISTSKVTNCCYGVIVVEFQGGVPLRVWDRLGFTAQEDTLPIRAKVYIGLNLNYTFLSQTNLQY